MERTGIVLYHSIDSGGELKGYARLAEDAGFESVWVTERYFHEETFSILGFLAASTERIKLGVGVVNPFTRHPALLAMGAATLDRISGGRFVLGMGRSDRPVIQDRMGISHDGSLDALGDAVGIVRRLLAGESVSARQGRFHLDDVGVGVRPVQDRLPIYLAGIGPRALRLAGQVADGVLLNAYTSTAYVRYAVGEIRDAATQAGRDPTDVDIACMLVVRPTDDPTSMRASLKERMVRLLDEPHVGEVLLENGGFDATILPALRESVATDGGTTATELIPDELLEQSYLIGTPDRIRKRVDDYRDAGVDLPLLLPRLESFEAVAKMFADD